MRILLKQLDPELLRNVRQTVHKKRKLETPTGGDDVYTYRVLLGWTGLRLARHFGVDHTQVARWENYRAKVPPNVLNELHEMCAKEGLLN